MREGVSRQPEETAALSMPLPQRISWPVRSGAVAFLPASGPSGRAAASGAARAFRSFDTRKRIVDVVVSLAVILLVLWWLIPLVGLLIRVDSPGPVFFVQERSGFQGRPFGCIKFRSMVVNRESDTKPAQSRDPRITTVGRIIRKYCIDELPQFINVLSGTMSLVGPRPHMIREDRYYVGRVALYSLRYRVKPGITGPGQLWAAGGLEAMEKMRMRARWDDWYIRHRSARLDARMLWLTCRYIVSKKDRPAQGKRLPVSAAQGRSQVPFRA